MKQGIQIRPLHPQNASSELIRVDLKARTKYKDGVTDHKVYRIWSRMKARCYNLNETNYHDYGGRGIRVYKEWIDNFLVFYDYVVNLPYYDLSKLNNKSGGYSLDRIDNDGNYEPNNVRWATRYQQNIKQRVRKDNASGYRGIGMDKNKDMWSVRISVHGQRIHLGHFKDIKKAVEVLNNYIIDNNLDKCRLQYETGNYN